MEEFFWAVNGYFRWLQLHETMAPYIHCCVHTVYAQVPDIGRQYLSSIFLKLPNAPQLTALGGINISQLTHDIGLAFRQSCIAAV